MKVQVVPALCLQVPAVLLSEPEGRVVIEVIRPPPAQHLSLTAKTLVIRAAQHSDPVALLVT